MEVGGQLHSTTAISSIFGSVVKRCAVSLARGTIRRIIGFDGLLCHSTSSGSARSAGDASQRAPPPLPMPGYAAFECNGSTVVGIDQESTRQPPFEGEQGKLTDTERGGGQFKVAIFAHRVPVWCSLTTGTLSTTVTDPSKMPEPTNVMTSRHDTACPGNANITFARCVSINPAGSGMHAKRRQTPCD